MSLAELSSCCTNILNELISVLNYQSETHDKNSKYMATITV